jgi:hypothetical protein
MDNKIVLDENFYIESDRYSWALHYQSDPHVKEVRGVEKEVTSKDTTYYATMKQALRAYCDKSLKGCGSIEEVLKKQDEVLKVIESIC